MLPSALILISVPLLPEDGGDLLTATSVPELNPRPSRLVDLCFPLGTPRVPMGHLGAALVISLSSNSPLPQGGDSKESPKVLDGMGSPKVLGSQRWCLVMAQQNRDIKEE